MRPDRTACIALTTGYLNHAFVGGYWHNHQPRCFPVHRPIVIGTIDLVCGNAAIDLNLIRPVNNSCRFLIKENNIGLR